MFTNTLSSSSSSSLCVHFCVLLTLLQSTVDAPLLISFLMEFCESLAGAKRYPGQRWRHWHRYECASQCRRRPHLVQWQSGRWWWQPLSCQTSLTGRKGKGSSGNGWNDELANCLHGSGKEFGNSRLGFKRLTWSPSNASTTDGPPSTPPPSSSSASAQSS